MQKNCGIFLILLSVLASGRAQEPAPTTTLSTTTNETSVSSTTPISNTTSTTPISVTTPLTNSTSAISSTTISSVSSTTLPAGANETAPQPGANNTTPLPDPSSVSSTTLPVGASSTTPLPSTNNNSTLAGTTTPSTNTPIATASSSTSTTPQISTIPQQTSTSTSTTRKPRRRPTRKPTPKPCKGKFGRYTFTKKPIYRKRPRVNTTPLTTTTLINSGEDDFDYLFGDDDDEWLRAPTTTEGSGIDADINEWVANGGNGPLEPLPGSRVKGGNIFNWRISP